MHYERWPDVDDPPSEMPEDIWPDGDPDELVTMFAVFMGAIRDAFSGAKTALKPLMDAGLIHSGGYDSRHAMLDEFGMEEWERVFSPTPFSFTPPPLPPIGYKTLPSGRLMPIVKYGTGPKIEPFRKRGARDAVGKKAPRERTYPTRR